MASWDDNIGLEHALDSVFTQRKVAFDRVHVVVFEDTSDSMFSLQQRERHSRHKVDVTFLSDPDSLRNMGAAYGKWRIFEWIRERALPHEYVFILDGDDTLPDGRVIHDLQRMMWKRKPWFAWGRHNGPYSEQCHALNLTSSLRRSVWSFCHPRIFQAHLLDHIQIASFQRDDGSWLQKATDRPFIYQFMEMAGPDRILYLHERPLYNYTKGAHNGLFIFKKSVINGDKDLVINRPAVPRSNELVHIISCVFTRNNTEVFLRRLMQSKLAKDQIMHIHICNNMASRQTELEVLAHRLMQSSVHHICVYDMGANLGGFGRFVLARRVMAQEFMDYTIMIDDDQLVRPSTIAEIYAQRKPMTYHTWYGKNWAEGEVSYWKPAQNMPTRSPADMLKKHPEVTTWQYGGTGLSIIDASVFSYNILYKLDVDFLFVEDMWLSHIVQVMKWNITRLFVDFDVAQEHSATGQWQLTGARQLKSRFFRRIGLLSCY